MNEIDEKTILLENRFLRRLNAFAENTRAVFNENVIDICDKMVNEHIRHKLNMARYSKKKRIRKKYKKMCIK